MTESDHRKGNSCLGLTAFRTASRADSPCSLRAGAQGGGTGAGRDPPAIPWCSRQRGDLRAWGLRGQSWRFLSYKEEKENSHEGGKGCKTQGCKCCF